jgi:four helix bundle protein
MGVGLQVWGGGPAFCTQSFGFGLQAMAFRRYFGGEYLNMARDHRKLRVFQQAHALLLEVYRATAAFPVEERYVLQAQVRRAAISAATNIVEGCARRTTREYVQFLNVANGSTAEAGYLLNVARRLGLVSAAAESGLEERYSQLTKGLQKVRSLEPKAQAKA